MSKKLLASILSVCLIAYMLSPSVALAQDADEDSLYAETVYVDGVEYTIDIGIDGICVDAEDDYGNNANLVLDSHGNGIFVADNVNQEKCVKGTYNLTHFPWHNPNPNRSQGGGSCVLTN